MRTLTNGIVLTTIGVLTTAAFAVAPPSDEQLEQAVAAYDETVAKAPDRSNETLRRAADEALGDIDLGALTFEQTERLLEASNVYFYSSQRDRLDKRLTEFSIGATLESARAAIYRLNLLDGKTVEQQHELVQAMLEQSKLAEALSDGELWSAFMNLVWWAQPESVKGLEPQLIALGKHIPHDAPMLGVSGLVDIFDTVAAADRDRYELREPLRLDCIAALERLAKYVDPNDPDLAKWNFARDIPGHIRNHIERLQGPAVRGTLVNGPAPPLDFLWASGDRDLESLDDLRGKVVVMDFWATWCVPCVASFPQMRTLVERYRDLPVEFLGVTSVQGAHYGPDGRVDCKDDPDKETKLMGEYIKAKDMTWTVVFARQPVYNPQYDVDGIPHVVIIDIEGRVRFRKLHPYVHHGRIIGHIDELLRAQGIEPPPAPEPADGEDDA